MKVKAYHRREEGVVRGAGLIHLIRLLKISTGS